jgi:hypothetical protein
MELLYSYWQQISLSSWVIARPRLVLWWAERLIGAVAAIRFYTPC